MQCSPRWLEVVNPPEAGLAVDLRDSGQVLDTVMRLLSPGPEWERLALRARLRYEANFTARHFEQRLLSALGVERQAGGAQRVEAMLRQESLR